MHDARSRRVVFVAHCLLNQNAKAPGLAGQSGVFEPLIGRLARSGVGIVQLPCPELEHVGLGRAPGTDTRQQYDTPEYRKACTRMAREVAGRLVEYLAAGYQVVAVLGVEGSPSCSVDRAPVLGPDGQRVLRPGAGLFVERILSELKALDLVVPLVGVPETPEAGDLDRALARIDRLLFGAEPDRPAGREPVAERTEPRADVDDAAFRVGADEDGLWCRRPDGTTERLAWSAIESVVIQTTRDVPIQPDAFWIIAGNGAKLVFPMGAEGEPEVLVHLQQLEGFDDTALVNAVASDASGRHVCFRRRAAPP